MCRLSWNLGASTSWNPQGMLLFSLTLLGIEPEDGISMFLRNVGITVLSIRCEHPRTGLAFTVNRWSFRISSRLCCRRDRPALYDFRTKCLGAGGRNGETLKELRHFLCTDINTALIFCPVISRTDSETWGGRESLSKEAGKSLTVVFCTSCSLHLHFTCGVGTFRSVIYDSMRPVWFRWHFNAWKRPGNFQNRARRAIYVQT
jgi:hypothetical protein